MRDETAAMTCAAKVALRLAALVPVLFLALGLSGMPASGARAAEWPAQSYVLQVDGLACPYCGYGIEKQFAGRDGVRGTEIHIEEAVVVVLVETGTRFSDSELKQIVHDAGFELGGIVHRPRDG